MDYSLLYNYVKYVPFHEPHKVMIIFHTYFMINFIFSPLMLKRSVAASYGNGINVIVI